MTGIVAGVAGCVAVDSLLPALRGCCGRVVGVLRVCCGGGVSVCCRCCMRCDS